MGQLSFFPEAICFLQSHVPSFNYKIYLWRYIDATPIRPYSPSSSLSLVPLQGLYTFSFPLTNKRQVFKFGAVWTLSQLHDTSCTVSPHWAWNWILNWSWQIFLPFANGDLIFFFIYLSPCPALLKCPAPSLTIFFKLTGFIPRWLNCLFSTGQIFP